MNDDNKVPAKSRATKTAKEWGAELKKKAHYVAGAKEYAGWKDDQQISQAEFEAKLAEWLNRPAGRRM
jgi:hypothetical protein